MSRGAADAGFSLTPPRDDDDDDFQRPPVAEPFEDRSPLQLAGKEELPLRLLIVGDFSARSDDTPVSARAIVAATSSTLSAALEHFAPEVELEVPNRIDEDSAEPLRLRFFARRIEDFSPEGVVAQHPALRKLARLRAALTALKGPLGGDRRFRNAIQRAVSDPARRMALAAYLGVETRPTAPADAADDRLVLQDEGSSISDPVRLRELAGHPDPFVQRAVAGNPAIDREVAVLLARLASPEGHRSTALQNPSVHAALTADPAFALALSAGGFVGEILAGLEWTEPVAAVAAAWERPRFRQELELLSAVMAIPRWPDEPGTDRPGRAVERIGRAWRWSPAHAETIGRWATMQWSAASLDATLDSGHWVEGSTITERLRSASTTRPWLWQAIASRAECPPDVLRTLSQCGLELVRLAIARNEATPSDILVRLADDPDPSVRELAARRVGVRVEPIRLYLSNAFNDGVLRAALERYAAASMRAAFLSAAPRPEQSMWCEQLFLRRQAAGPPVDDPSVRRLYDPRTPESALRPLVDDHAFAVAIHPNASRPLLEYLGKSSVPWVRLAAQTRLMRAVATKT